MGSIDALIQQLHSGSISAQHEAVAELSMLQLTPCSWLSAIGAIPRLVQLLRSTATATPRAASIRLLLRRISTESQYLGGLEAAPEGVIPPLVSMLLLHDDADLQRVAALALSTLALNIGDQLKIMEAGAIVPLIQLLNSSSGSLHFPAARALAFLAENRSVRTRIVAAGAIGPLLQLFGSSTVMVQLSAATAVRTIAGEDPDLVIAAGAVPLLVQLLKSSSPDVQEEAAEALGCLAANVSAIAQVIAAGAIPLLVGLLETSGASAEKLRWKAASTLAPLAVSAQSEVITAGAIEPLVRSLRSGSEGLQSAAVVTLAALSCGSEAAQARIAAAGAIDPLVQVLEAAQFCEGVHAHAAMVLWDLALTDTQPVVSAGAIPALVQRLTGSSNESLQIWVSHALGSIADNFDTHTEILAASPLLPLVCLLTSDSEEVQEQAQRMLLQLSTTPTFPKQFVAAGAVPPLVHLLRSESASVQQRALTILGLLTANGWSDIFAPVESAGTLPLLAHLQTAASSATIRYCTGRLLQALTTGTSPFDEQEKCRSALPSTAASVRAATAACSPSSVAAALAPASASHQQQQQQLPPRPRKSCWSCGAVGVPLKKCSVCAVAAYCGAGCQKTDWKAHKGQCAGLKAGAASLPEGEVTGP